MKAIAVFRDGLSAPGFFLGAALLFQYPLFGLGGQLADGFPLFARLQCSGDQAFELLQGGPLIQQLGPPVAGADNEQPFFADAVSQFLPDPLFFGLAEHLGMIYIKKKLHFSLYLVNMLPAAA